MTASTYPTRDGLVRGFAIFDGFRLADQARLYKHVAVTVDGRVALTEDAFPLNEPNFDKNGRKWYWADSVNAETDILARPLGPDFHWLGNYHAPAALI